VQDSNITRICARERVTDEHGSRSVKRLPSSRMRWPKMRILGRCSRLQCASACPRCQNIAPNHKLVARRHTRIVCWRALQLRWRLC